MPAHYQAISLRDLLTENKNGKIVLPNFQRGFVWDIDKQKRLLSTFMCGLPIGSLLMLEGQKEDFACRSLNFTDDSPYIAQECKFLLDGQQRLSSLCSYFNDLYYECEEYDVVHDSLYPALRNRWFLRLKVGLKETDVFGWRTLSFDESDIFQYEPNELLDFIYYQKIFKKDKNQWWHPCFSLKAKSINQKSESVKNEVAENLAREGLVPLWDFFDKPDKGIHDLVLRKIGEKRRHDIEAAIRDEVDDNLTYHSVLQDIDYDVQDKIKNDVDIEDLWIELRTNWKKNIITCIKGCLEQEIPVVKLPTDEVSRAVATFSAVNEGGTKLSTYDLIVARAAKNREQESLTQRIISLLKQKLTSLSSVFASNSGATPNSWSIEDFGVIDDNVPGKHFKEIFLNTLSIYKHCFVNKQKTNIDHIKIKGILSLDHNDINNNLEQCIDSIIMACAFLTFRCGIININQISYKLMLLPIIQCFFEKETFLNKEKLDKIEYWYWLSLFAGRYREYQNETCVKDIDDL